MPPKPVVSEPVRPPENKESQALLRLEVSEPVRLSEKGRILKEKKAREAEDNEILLALRIPEEHQKHIAEWIWLGSSKKLEIPGNFNRINDKGELEKVTEFEFYNTVPFEQRFYAEDDAIEAARKGYAVSVRVGNRDRTAFYAEYRPDRPAGIAYVKLGGQEERINPGAAGEVKRQ